jgi:hypothetical protein
MQPHQKEAEPKAPGPQKRSRAQGPGESNREASRLGDVRRRFPMSSDGFHCRRFAHQNALYVFEISRLCRYNGNCRIGPAYSG